ncbi:hypothetical protein [Joostella sp. CR20]|uniref:hypothetical protein n=1 Tax=Joostella sp. CR20 TaxID=2804312 RepID=UPI00313F02BF
MKKKHFIIVGGLLVCLCLIVISANTIISNILQKKITTLNNYKIEVENINTNVLTRTVTATNIKAVNDNKDSLQLNEITIEGIDFAIIWNQKEIKIDKVIAEKGLLNLHQKKEKNKSNSDEDFKLNVKRIAFKNIDVNYSSEKNNRPLQTKNIEIEIDSFQLDLNSEKEKIIYKDFNIKTENTVVPINDHLDFKIGKIAINKKYIKTEKLTIKTLYSKEELQKHIQVQTDWVDLEIDSILINNYTKKIANDTTLFDAKTMAIYKADLEIYKNKLLPEPNKYKPLYSKAIRNLPFKINIAETVIENSKIQYSERVKNYDEPGTIVFTHVNSKIENLSNLQNVPETFIDIHSKFMGDAHFNLKWKFDVNNKADFFTLHGNMQNLNAEEINAFVMPNMNVKTSGAIRSVIFDVFANENEANGTFRLKYEDFKITIHKKNTTVINKFFTNLANLFLKNTKKDNKDVSIKVERDKQKSFFNYLWLCVQEGTLQTVL